MGSRGREIRMSSPTHLLTAFLLLSATGATWGQADEDFDFNGPVYDFVCPELNGLFADSEQCDLYYVCIDNVATATLCKDGYLFDDSIRNHEKCVLPHNVDCKGREFVQARQAGIDDRCDRANGLFNHESPDVCDRFYSCDNGTAHEMPCAFPLIFDVTVGACVRPEQATPEAKKCDTGVGEDAQSGLKEIDGFRCPGKEIIGPQGILQAHPVLPHPTDCQFFFTCFFGKDPNKFGCTKGEVFDATSLTCKTPDKVPDCKCWYECEEDSRCPGECAADCTCPGDRPPVIDELEGY